MDRSTKNLLLLAATVCLTSTFVAPSFADTANNHSGFTLHKPTHYYIGVQGGFSHHITKSTDVLASSGGTLVTGTNDSLFTDYSVKVGIITPLSDKLSLHLGASYTGNKAQKMKGFYYQIPPAVDPDPDASYTYNLNLDRLMIDTKLYYKQNATFSYFGGFSIGQVLMKTSPLAFVPITGAIPPSNDAQIHGGMAYAINAGLDVSVTQHWHLLGGLSQQWLGHQKMTVHEGSTKNNIDFGAVNPFSVWAGVNYVF